MTGEEAFAHELCRELGIATPEELATRMDARQFGRWHAYLTRDQETPQDRARAIFGIE